MISNSLLQVWPIPAFTDNSINFWSIHDQQSTILVDPGEAKPAIDYLTQQNLRLIGILITHYHTDHIGRLPEILAWASQRSLSVPIYRPTGDEIVLAVTPSLRLMR